ncbi:hypothetical protein [Thermoplasma volcanium GSS1]|uniref:Type I restriction modification DNA specificity domain-containing protein n=1 Tax=Thermoplasma volcanium (strain ATCC 51530 / DSM 4299 / JCM 9571 / NBRC 15438 / GSS1) TaxID=273116 RepID=Q97BJ2_THEVO|nr:hypothetical protein [Thermoplasma volcanium GSS1]
MIALNGQGKTKGMVGILKVESTCNQSLAAFNVNERTLHYRYLYYFLKSKYKQMRGLVGDDLRDGLSLSVLRELRIPVPSLQEQFAISNYSDNQIHVIKNMISKQEKMIELLKEHRASLITPRSNRQDRCKGISQGGERICQTNSMKLILKIT